jgi:hypothetical protein
LPPYDQEPEPPRGPPLSTDERRDAEFRSSVSPAVVLSVGTVSCDLEARPDRPFGFVLVRLGPTEIGKHTVPEELGDVSLKTRDLTGHGILIFPDEFKPG